MSLEAGTHLGRYEIRSLLGAGGMGEVYLAEDTKLGRAAALKVLPSEVASDQGRMRRFVQEARLASSLNHPHIVTIYEIEDEARPPFIAAEFIDGETLRGRMRAGGMNLGEVLRVCEQITSALAAAHEAGIVHRDVKPENVMIRRDGYAKVLDFGLAKLTERGAPSVDTEAQTRALVKTDPGAVMGTVNYMSPEQARGQAVDARTDIWSLGVVLFEMLTGQTPFRGKSAGHTIVAIQDEEPPPLARFAPEAPEALQELINDALAKDPDARPSAKQLLARLNRLRRRLDAGAHLDQSVAPNLTAGGADSSGAATGTQAGAPSTYG
ncbi:MAG: serine/threonine protein kinase, partial [Acidobacteria bacterium]|nr:serine/threonine protein kinase [Acidobacteriota bacterium]MCA1642391.1 serine/threonine protein kinase [Acidobacteriota bacterium]